MKKTALLIIQEVLQRVNIPSITAIVGSTDPNVLQLKQVLYAVVEELRQVGTWTQQKRKYSFDTVAAVSKYALPKDFYCPLMNTQYNNDENDILIGPISDAEFAFYLNGGTTAGHNYYYRLFGWDNVADSDGGQFEITPTPGSAQELSLEYMTRHLFLPANYVLGTAYAENALVNVNGNIYKCSSAITEADTAPSGTGAAIADDDGTWDYYNEPYEVLAADTDIVLFDYDLVKLGIRAKWSGEKNAGIYSQMAEKEYQKKIDKARARMKGSFIGSMTGTQLVPGYTVPYRNWSL